jgi:hypothetical protein
LQSFFDSPLYNAAGSQTSNSNNSANLKPNLKRIEDMNQGQKWTLLMKKNRAEKSRATVPLREIFNPFFNDESKNAPIGLKI